MVYIYIFEKHIHKLIYFNNTFIGTVAAHSISTLVFYGS